MGWAPRPSVPVAVISTAGARVRRSIRGGFCAATISWPCSGNVEKQERRCFVQGCFAHRGKRFCDAGRISRSVSRESPGKVTGSSASPASVGFRAAEWKGPTVPCRNAPDPALRGGLPMRAPGAVFRPGLAGRPPHPAHRRAPTRGPGRRQAAAPVTGAQRVYPVRRGRPGRPRLKVDVREPTRRCARLESFEAGRCGQGTEASSPGYERPRHMGAAAPEMGRAADRG